MPTLLDTPKGQSGTIDRNTNRLVSPSLAPVINSQALQPVTPFKLTPVAPATQSAGLSSYLESTTDSFNKDLAAKATASEKAKDTSLEALLKNTINSPGEIALTADKYKDTVDPAEAELKDINQQILANQVSTRRQIEELQKNPQGLFGGGLQQKIQEIQDVGTKREADLSVIQLAKQGKYDSAKQIADRAVAAQLETQRTKNEALRLIYEDNKSLFDKDEQRAFETRQNDRERVLDKRESDLKQISDLSLNALQNGAPTAIATQMRQAKTPEEAIQVGGQYIDRLDRQYKIAQINKIGLETLQIQAEKEDRKNGILSEKDIQAIDKSPQGAKVKTAGDLKLKLSSYQDLVEKYGFEISGPEKAVLENAYIELQLAYKEAANLGVLNGPDLTLVEGAIRSATPGLFGNVGNILRFGGGTRNLKANLEQAQSTLNNAAALNLEQLYSRNPSYRNSQYVQSLTLPFGDELLLSEEKAAMDAVLNSPN